MDDERAFPLQAHADPLYEGRIAGHPGMTLRDYFAGQALMGLLSGRNTDERISWVLEAYEFADAMLKIRGRAKDNL